MGSTASRNLFNLQLGQISASAYDYQLIALLKLKSFIKFLCWNLSVFSTVLCFGRFIVTTFHVEILYFVFNSGTSLLWTYLLIGNKDDKIRFRIRMHFRICKTKKKKVDSDAGNIRTDCRWIFWISEYD